MPTPVSQAIDGPTSTAITTGLLGWYDRHRRDLPWRAAPGRDADPYAVWLSEIMLQQTTVAAVKPYYARFLAAWPSVAALAAAPREEVMRMWAGLGYYARARNLHACAQAVADQHGGRFPSTETELRVLPGIGDYTAAAVASIAFGEPASVVDGNVERVITRLFAVDTPLPAAKPLVRRLVSTLVPADRPGDFAQATMDFGATLCTPKTPACGICPVRTSCLALAAGDPAGYPRKRAKAMRPQRFGAVAVIQRRDGAVLVRTRPPTGLLGGMTEFIGTAWAETPPDVSALRRLADESLTARGPVDHVFTHFALRLDVYHGVTSAQAAPTGCRWVVAGHVDREALPNLMLKVFRQAQRLPEQGEPSLL